MQQLRKDNHYVPKRYLKQWASKGKIFAHHESDIQMIRPRKVCPETFKREQLAWQCWHNEQSKAEADLLS